MAKISNSEKNKLSKALVKSKIKGLKSYSDYLHNQLVSAAKSSKKKAYKKYLESQIEQTDLKLDKLKSKLK